MGVAASCGPARRPRYAIELAPHVRGAIDGDVVAIEEWFATGTRDPDERDSHGLTLLRFAVMGGRCDIIRVLLDHGADPNAPDVGWDDGAETPLFAAEDGRPYSHGMLDGRLRAMLTCILGATQAELYSWHSARIGLACALRASGCPPDTVQLICRWMCPGSLRVYALKGVSEHASWVVKAMRAHVDAVRGTSYPVISAGEGMVNMQAELTQQWTVGRQATTEAEPLTRAARVTPVRRQRLTNKPLLPKRDPALGRLMQQHRVMCPPGRVRVAEKQRLLLVACPRLAQRYEVPPDVLAAAGVASHAPEAPPSDIEDVD